MKNDTSKNGIQVSLFGKEGGRVENESGRFGKVIDLMKYKEKKYLESFYHEIDNIISHLKNKN